MTVESISNQNMYQEVNLKKRSKYKVAIQHFHTVYYIKAPICCDSPSTISIERGYCREFLQHTYLHKTKMVRNL